MTENRDKRIYEDFDNGMSRKELSEKYSLSATRISEIIRKVERKKDIEIRNKKKKDFENLKPCDRCINKGICKYVNIEIPKIEYPFTIVCEMQENINFNDWLKESVENE